MRWILGRRRELVASVIMTIALLAFAAIWKLSQSTLKAHFENVHEGMTYDEFLKTLDGSPRTWPRHGSRGGLENPPENYAFVCSWSEPATTFVPEGEVVVYFDQNDRVITRKLQGRSMKEICDHWMLQLGYGTPPSPGFTCGTSRALKDAANQD